MKKIILALVSLSLFSCNTAQHFAERKYLKGRFSDPIEQYAVNSSPLINNKNTKITFLLQTAQKDSSKIDFATASIGAVPIQKNTPVRNKNFRYAPPLQIPAPLLAQYRTDSIPSAKKVNPNLNAKSNAALIYGILSLTLPIPIYTIISLTHVRIPTPLVAFNIMAPVCAILALVKAKKVRHNPDATKKQKQKAVAGKIMGIICLIASGLIIFVGALFIVAFFSM